MVLFQLFPLYHGHHSISYSTGKPALMKSERVRVVSLSTTEMSDITRLEIRSSGSITLKQRNALKRVYPLRHNWLFYLSISKTFLVEIFDVT